MPRVFFFLVMMLSVCVAEHRAVREGHAPSKKDDVMEEEDAPAHSVSSSSGLALPRFVSLKASKANLHRGPTQTSEVQWVYVKPKMPLEILAEHDHWRYVRDYQGTIGWMHKALLSGRRYVLIEKQVTTLRAKPKKDSEVIATAEPGVIGRLLECKGAVCHIEIDGIKGWAPRASLFGVYPDEEKIT